MSVQFGRWSFVGESLAPEYLEKVSARIAPYGPDSKESYSGNGIKILYRAFHTTKEARCEKQPHICRSGAVITWDGRLDNRDELIEQLKPYVTLEDSDITFVAAAFERWGTRCFAALIGDWALSIWDPSSHSLILAKDPIGPRHLYYALDDRQITWCTVLDPLVLFADKTFKLCEEYLAGWLSLYPAKHLTPYVGIHAVPASTCVFLGPKKHIVAKYWDFDPDKKIRYRSDREYEEHFRSVFFKAVQRRLRSNTPVLAELSGGRDSSSIVCVADEIIARGQAESPRLDTISYFDDSEPNWNERPYFTLVEKKRGRTGWHIDFSINGSDELAHRRQRADQTIVPAPSRRSTSTQVDECIERHGYRSVLSGIGGDEVLGGIPTPTPELQDLLLTAQFGKLLQQLRAWAFEKRKPWLSLFFEAAAGFLPPRLIGVPKQRHPPIWLESAFLRRQWLAVRGYPMRTKFFVALPTFQDNISTLEQLRRQLACKILPAHPIYEKRYSYLDRRFLEFIYSIPSAQLMRPSQRRSLMRRALADTVPAEILYRKRKANLSRAPLIRLLREQSRFQELRHGILSSSLGIVNPERIADALQKAKRGEEINTRHLMRALYIENWLQQLSPLKIVERFSLES